MDTHRFFVGTLSDIEGNNTYLNNPVDDHQTAESFQQQQGLDAVNTDSSLPTAMRDQTIWDSQVLQHPSAGGVTNQPSPMYFNPSLELPEAFKLPQKPSPTPVVTRSSTRTRSSSNSITLAQLKSPASSTMVATPAMTTPELSPRTTTRHRRKPRKVKSPPPEDEDDQELEDSVTVAMDEDPRREKHLERNRVAASKCRQKKKYYVADLEETKQELETANSRLQTEFKGLQEEVYRIKDELRSHANCHDDNINSWIDNEARKFVTKTRFSFDSLHLEPSPTPSHRPLSDGGMNAAMHMTPHMTPLPIEVGQHPGAVMMGQGYRGPMFTSAPSPAMLAYSQAPTPSLSTTPIPDFGGMSPMPPPPPGGPGMGYGHMPGNMF